MSNYTAQSFWSKNKRGFIKEEAIYYENTSQEILIKSLYSGISYGTEKIVFDCKVPENQKSLMKAPHQVGEFNNEIKYGYMNVGKIIDGPSNLKGKKVYTMYPHQSLYAIKINQASTIPNNLPIKRALLTANMETAINAVWDSKPTIGDNVYVIGAGIVGLLTGYVLSKIIGVNVTVIDNNINKKELVLSLNMNFSSKINIINRPDIIYECSGNTKVLSDIIKFTDLETKVCILSWYGDQVSKINMGENCFSKRIKFIFSQVSNISAYKAKKWDNESRRALALRLLCDNKLDLLLDKKEITIDEISNFLKSNNKDGLCKIVRY